MMKDYPRGEIKRGRKSHVSNFQGFRKPIKPFPDKSTHLSIMIPVLFQMLSEKRIFRNKLQKQTTVFHAEVTLLQNNFIRGE